MNSYAVKSHKRIMIDDMKKMISQDRSIYEISTRLFFKGCDYKRRSACNDVVALYFRTADIVSGMTRESLIKALERGYFL
jgi:hypothetical protein